MEAVKLQNVKQSDYQTVPTVFDQIIELRNFDSVHSESPFSLLSNLIRCVLRHTTPSEIAVTHRKSAARRSHSVYFFYVIIIREF